ncbi:hypothetical protein RYX36_010598 [Vicia faba]
MNRGVKESESGTDVQPVCDSLYAPAITIITVHEPAASRTADHLRKEHHAVVRAHAFTLSIVTPSVYPP